MLEEKLALVDFLLGARRSERGGGGGKRQLMGPSDSAEIC